MGKYAMEASGAVDRSYLVRRDGSTYVLARASVPPAAAAAGSATAFADTIFVFPAQLSLLHLFYSPRLFATPSFSPLPQHCDSSGDLDWSTDCRIFSKQTNRSGQMQTDYAYMKQRVDYKLATLVYNLLRGQAPSYLVDDCQPIADSRRPRLPSAHANVLTVPRTNTRLSDRSFLVTGPRIWSSPSSF